MNPERVPQTRSDNVGRGRARAVACAAVLASLLEAGGAPAAGLDRPSAARWIDPGVELLAGVQSARVLLADQALLGGPWGTAPRRGSAARDAHLPIFAAKRGPGCQGPWLQVGPLAWVCQDAVEPSTVLPIAPGQRMVPESFDGLPYRYFFVGPGGSAAYKQLEAVDVGEPDMALQPGFAVAIAGERTIDGAHYGRTEHGLWVPMRDLGAVRSFTFRGEELTSAPGSPIPVAWVIADRARVLAKPAAGALTSAVKLRFDAVPVLEVRDGVGHVEGDPRTPGPAGGRTGGGFLRIGDGAWIAARDVRHPVVSDPPPEVDASAGERWIDVDLETQTLVAYEGRRPVFATLVSTGKGQPGTPLGTPRGTHRIWIKLLTSDMDNLEDENASRYYRIEDVPWVQYFSKGVGLHGAFWHRGFGQVRSHGCVNLSPIDAERLFWWTGPHLPAGWTAAFPTVHEQGTVIRVR